MITHTPSFNTAPLRPSTGVRESFPHVASPRVDAPVSVEEIVANHTAVKPSRKLCRSYVAQSVVTGLPLVVVDIVVSAVALLASSLLINCAAGNVAVSHGIWLQLPVFLVLQLVMLSLHQLYPGAGVSQVGEMRGIVRSTLYSMICLSAMNLLLGQLPRIELITFACATALAVVWLPIARSAARQLLARTSWWGVRSLLIGSAEDCQQILRKGTIRRASGFVVVGCAYSDQSNSAASASLGRVEQTVQIAEQENASVAMIGSPDMELYSQRLSFQLPSVVSVGRHATAETASDLVQPCIKLVTTPLLRFMPRLCKRCLDVLLCIVVGTVLAIPMLLIALVIKLKSPGPVLYASQRIGQHGKSFKMWKFRSMVVNAEQVLQERLNSDPAARQEWADNRKLKDDPRIIPGIGHLLRHWSLDELPQLWNVLRGEMSLVGPRPLLPCEIIRYQNRYYDYTQMWPGVTGLWQVSGRNETTFETRIHLVQNYAANWSLWLDACILLKTPMVVLTRRGAY